jgi:hypothetical protein
MTKFLCAVCLLLGCGHAMALDRQAFTFIDYKLQVRVTPATQTLQASGKIILRNDSAQPQRNPVLQISSSLQWHTITVADKPVQYQAQTYTSDLDHTGALSEVVITLPQPVPPQGTVGIEVAYSGTVPQDATRLTRIGTPASQAARSDWDRISESFTALRGAGYANWYPIATEAASLSDGNAVFDNLGAWKQREAPSTMNLTICAPAGMHVVANDAGNAAPTARDIAGAKWSCRETVYTPLGSAVPTVVIGAYQTLNHPPASVEHVAGHESYARDWASAAEKVAPLIAQWFGTRRQPVRIVELPLNEALPFESGNALFTPLVNPEAQSIELAVAHRLAHASFQSPRPWIDEGLAHFAQALEREQQAGRKEALAYMDQQLPPLREAEKEFVQQGAAPPSLPKGEPLVTTNDEVFYRTKAMFVWWMLRDMVGDEALGRAIRAYRPEQDKEPSYIQRLLAAEFHRDLEWFFDDWVYRDRGLPDFRVSAVYPRALLPAEWSVTVTIENLGGAGAEVPVLVRAAQGEAQKRAEVHAREKAVVVRIPMPAAPQQAIVNDGSIPESNMENNTADIKAQQTSSQ